jgi:DNA-binding transcriptional ArsR family regulator
MADLRRPPKLFGSARRTEVLLMLALLGETYPAELTRLLGATKASVIQILAGLEAEGVVASRLLGRTRRVSLDPRYFGAKELTALLGKLASGRPELRRLAAARRARPRRTGKPL